MITTKLFDYISQQITKSNGKYNLLSNRIVVNQIAVEYNSFVQTISSTNYLNGQDLSGDNNYSLIEFAPKCNLIFSLPSSKGPPFFHCLFSGKERGSTFWHASATMVLSIFVSIFRETETDIIKMLQQKLAGVNKSWKRQNLAATLSAVQ